MKIRYMILAVGILSVIVGTMYMPIFPWYVLGGETEAEITLWGIWSMIGGFITIGGFLLLYLKNTSVIKTLYILAFLGMLLIILGQILPIIMWIMFWGTPITDGGVSNPTIGGLFGLMPHIVIVILASAAFFSILKLLAGKSSKLRLTKRETLTALGILVVIFAIWSGIDAYQSKTWIKSTTPKPGEENVSIYTVVRATWEGERYNIGIRVRYADEPDRYIPGTTSGTPNSISFGPEGGFEPGKKVKVIVEAGRRTYTYTFTTENRTE